MWWIKLERWWLFQMAMKRWWLRKESHGKEVYQKFPLNQGKDHLLRRSNMDNRAYIFKAICRSRDCRTILHHDGGGAPLIYHIESTPFGWLMEHGRGTGGCRVLPTGAPWFLPTDFTRGYSAAQPANGGWPARCSGYIVSSMHLAVNYLNLQTSLNLMWMRECVNYWVLYILECFKKARLGTGPR